MLLTHLRDPRIVIENWATQLRPQGLLLLEEVDMIHPALPLFRAYLDIVAAMLEQQANELYIGPYLDQQQIDNGLRRRVSRVYRLPVSTRQAATMFYLNILSWKKQPFIQQHYAASTIEHMEQNTGSCQKHPRLKARSNGACAISPMSVSHNWTG